MEAPEDEDEAGLIDLNDAKAVFKRFDTNSNGVLDLDEFTSYLTVVFTALSDTPAFQVHGASAEQMALATALTCFEEADLNHDGALTFDEFLNWFEQSTGAKATAMPPEEEYYEPLAASAAGKIHVDDARAVFDTVDVDRNGVLDIGEFTDYLTSMFEALSHTDAFRVHGVSPRAMAEATAQQCFEDADVNHDGVVSFDEFKVGVVVLCCS